MVTHCLDPPIPTTWYRTRSPRLTAVIAAIVLAALGCLSLASPAASAPRPSVAAGLLAEIDATASYSPQTSCEPIAKPGTVRLASLLTQTYPGTRTGTARACGSVPNSEHYDGRAIDWMVSVRNTGQRNQATTLLAWLLASDAEGNAYANARRLGVMYLIWNNKIWGAYNADRGWRPYSTCADHGEKSWDSTCHRNHVHISLAWAGAQGKTSYWTQQIAAPDHGPCRSADLNWAAPLATANPIPCARYPAVKPPKGASATLKALTSYSGMVLRQKSTGPAVKAVQKVVGVSPTGTYGQGTRAAVLKWQRAHGLKASGGINHTTWRALLKDQAPS